MTVQTLPAEVTTTEPTVDTTALSAIEEKVVTGVHLADLMRRGSEKTVQSTGWGYGGMACGLSAAALEAKDLGFLK